MPRDSEQRQILERWMRSKGVIHCAAWGRPGGATSSQGAEEKDCHLGVEEVHGKAPEKEAPESWRVHLPFCGNELLLAQKRPDAEIYQVDSIGVLDHREGRS